MRLSARLSESLFRCFQMTVIGFSPSQFPNKELFKGFPDEHPREPDVVAELRSQEGEREIVLARLSAREYLETSPLGAALAALMGRPKGSENLELRARMLKRVVESGLDQGRQLLLVTVIEIPGPSSSPRRLRSWVDDPSPRISCAELPRQRIGKPMLELPCHRDRLFALPACEIQLPAVGERRRALLGQDLHHRRVRRPGPQGRNPLPLRHGGAHRLRPHRLVGVVHLPRDGAQLAHAMSSPT